jgi:hypothetical protein
MALTELQKSAQRTYLLNLVRQLKNISKGPFPRIKYLLDQSHDKNKK